MDINRNNYEAFLLDLLEGRLSVEEERELNEFLKHHPEHVVDLPHIDLFSLEKNHVIFPGKDQLRKEFPVADTRISATNFDLFSIARMEGDLSTQQEEEHRAMVNQDASKLEEWSTWQKTRLVPERIQYQGKKSLKRKKAVRGRMIWLSVLSVAATLTLLLILLRTDPLMPGQEPSVARQEAPVVIQEPAVAELRQEPSVVIREEPSVAGQQKTVVAVNKPEEKRDVESTTGLNGSSIHITTEDPEPRPIRIAGQLSASSGLVSFSSSDHIEPLHIPPVSSNLTSLSMAQIAELDRQKLFDEFAKEHNISLMSVANAGIKGINKITGSDISLLASRDEQGDVTGFRLKSKRFSVTSPLARKE
jgi:hypothetical protein